MHNLTRLLIVGTALTIMAIPAFAAGSNNGSGSSALVINGQVNLNTIWTDVNANVHDSGGDVAVGGSAVGNTAEVVTFSDTSVKNDQSNWGVIGTNVNTNVSNVAGNVSVSAASACNSVDVSTDPHVTAINNHQLCGNADPSATIDATIGHISGGVGVTAQAVGNQLSTDSNAAKFPVNSVQQNQGGVFATVNTNISHVGGGANVSASAAGNSSQIIQY
jgi:hypothetical protein